MAQITFSESFQKQFCKIKDNSVIEHVEKSLIKIKENPEIGKPMRYNKKGTREVYIGSFRLSYSFDKNTDTLFILSIYHKDEQ